VKREPAKITRANIEHGQ